ncbi:MAG: FmdE family protein [Desulfohalobiaceae bacterium]
MQAKQIEKQDSIQKTIEFHGHWCPGLGIGIRAAQWAAAEMGKSPDEEMVAVVETDMCGVDAIQFLTGCTFGKGNLIHKDYGKNAFTFYRRSDGYAVRLVLRPSIYGENGQLLRDLQHKMLARGLSDEEKQTFEQTRQEISQRIMDLDLEDVFEFKEPQGLPPRKARLFNSVTCAGCGESVMETRARLLKEQVMCIPCFEAQE